LGMNDFPAPNLMSIRALFSNSTSGPRPITVEYAVGSLGAQGGARVDAQSTVRRNQHRRER
jgi:hypothetical protein